MKKITLLITLMISSLGFSQNLITNGDFENDAVGWSGNAANVVSENGNKYNSASVENAGNGFDVNLSYVLPMTIGTKYKLTFDAFSDGSRTLIAGIGLNQDPWTNTVQTVNLTAISQTFVLELTANFTSQTSRIIFDMGAATGFVGIDNVILEEVIDIPTDNSVLIEDFETSSKFSIRGFEGLMSATIERDPASGAAKQNVLQIISTPNGKAWQGAEVLLINSKIKLTTNKTVKVDVYSSQAFTLLGKAEAGDGPASAAAASYTTPGVWQTLTFTFNQALDNSGIANGEYSKIAFFPNWKADNSGFGTPTDAMAFIDNITAEKVVVEPPFVPVAAPIPSTPDSGVLSLYGDTGNFTNNWISAYSFGSFAGKLDLDSGSGVNEAIKMDFSVAGYGEGRDATDISNYNYLHFDYYVDPNLAAGANEDQVRFILIGNGEHYYEMTTAGSDGTLVKGSWQSVNVPLSFFANKGFSKTGFIQFKLGTASVLNTKIVFFDNIYLSVDLPTTLGTAKFEKSNLKVYPNPASTNVTIEANSAIERVSIFNILGQEVLSKSPKANNTTLDISNLQKGTYIVRTTSEGKTETTKVLKK